MIKPQFQISKSFCFLWGGKFIINSTPFLCFFLLKKIILKDKNSYPQLSFRCYQFYCHNHLFSVSGDRMLEEDGTNLGPSSFSQFWLTSICILYRLEPLFFFFSGLKSSHSFFEQEMVNLEVIILNWDGEKKLYNWALFLS